MARREKKLSVIGLVVGVVGFTILGVAGFWFSQVVFNPFHGAETLTTSTYLSSAKSLQGGSYLIIGIFDEFLTGSTEKGKIVSVQLETESVPVVLPILIKNEFGDFNIQKGQKIKILASVEPSGLLVAKKISKQ